MSAWTRPPTGFITITPSDTTVYTPPLKSLWIGGAGAGSLAVVGADNVKSGNPQLDPGPTVFLSVGTGLFRGYISKVMSTDTDVTDIRGYR